MFLTFFIGDYLSVKYILYIEVYVLIYTKNSLIFDRLLNYT